MNLKSCGATVALALAVASCGPGSKTDQSPSATPSDAKMAMNDPNDPFAAADMAMSQAMKGAVGTDVSDTWLQQMIEHHRGAIAMSKAVLDRNPTKDARQMAQQTITKQGREIDDLTKLLGTGSADPTSLEPYRKANQAMDDAMMAAKGKDVSETYLRKMLAHHRGAVALSDVVLAQGKNPEVRKAAAKTRADQAMEAGMIQDMLTGKPMKM